jgi:hypothetical protein
MGVELVRQGPFLLLQFNMGCLEALPACGAQCCRMRPEFSVPLTEEELAWMPSEIMGEIRVLAGTPEGDCWYLKDSRCSIYDRRPKACREWHCSPRGGLMDPEIVKRDAGWALWPARSGSA